MKQKLNNINTEFMELTEEEKIIEEKLKKIDDGYKIFKKIILLIITIAGTIAAILGHKIGTKLSSDNKYKLDNEFDMFDNSKIEINNSQNIKKEKSSLNQYKYTYQEKKLTEEDTIELVQMIMGEKYDVKLSYNQIEKKHLKNLTKSITKRS